MLHGLFEFAIRREWCDKNPIKRIERRKVVEKEIQPLKLSETKRLIKTAQRESPIYAVVAALLVYTGRRLNSATSIKKAKAAGLKLSRKRRRFQRR